MAIKSDVLKWKDDGLTMLESGTWTQAKDLHLFNYIQMFSTGMKNLWDKRVYVDLYAGPGCCRIQGTKNIFKGSPLLALSVNIPFDKYVFCEKEPANLSALQQRISRLNAGVEVKLIEGDCNEKVESILAEIPQYSKSQTVLTFCFVDPFDLGVQFRTIKRLAEARKTDFLVLLALYMDANRNERHYTNIQNRKVDLFLDSPDWRDRWKKFSLKSDSFAKFLAQEFEKRMLALGYLRSEKNTKVFRSSEKNLPLYHLAFFSRSERGYDFWEKGTRSSDPQIPLDFQN